MAIFIIALCSSLYLYDILRLREENVIRNEVVGEGQKLGLIINSDVTGKILGLKRMGQRWEAAHGTPEDQWRKDAINFTAQVKGLSALEWVDRTYHVQWVESLSGSEKAMEQNKSFDDERQAALKEAAARDTITLTPPLDLTEGYRAFLAYAPIRRDGAFDGFMVAVYSADALFNKLIAADVKNDFDISVADNDKPVFDNKLPGNAVYDPLAVRNTFQAGDRQWVVTLVPSRQFVSAHRTWLPVSILIGGSLIGLLLSFTVRAYIVAKIQSANLVQSNKLNTAIMSGTSYLMIATDPAGRITAFNRAAEDTLGYRAANMIGKHALPLWHDRNELERRAAELGHALNSPVASGFEVFVAMSRLARFETREWAFIRSDGTRFPGNMSVTSLRDEHNEITGYLCVIEDITQRKIIEETLRLSEETFRSAMEAAPIGMAMVKPDGRWIKVNPALCQLLGYSDQELLSADFQSITHEEDLEQDLKLVRQALSGEIDHYQMEKRYYHKGGRVIWALLSVSLVRDGDGMPNYFISQIQDITEQKEIERMKSEFISIVSHELRTPLTSIRGSLGLIIGALSTDLPDKVKNLIDIAHSNCERLILLINDILDIDKIAAGQMRFDIKTVPIAATTRQAVQSNMAYAEKFGITINLRAMDEALEVSLDPARYDQVLSNLLSNAVKFSPPGTAVEVFATSVGNSVRIGVKDSGPGIPEEFRPRIFGKFAQADSSAARAKGGTGLGLHITRQLVEHMGGSIGFETEIGKGTIFWVQFPVVAKEARIGVDAGTNGILHYRHDTGGIAPILHVEDDTDLSHVLSMALQGKAEIVVATTLRDAKQLLQERRFLMVILDIGLPDGSGLSLLEHMDATLEATPPVVILSAEMAPREIREKVAASIVKSRVSETRIVETNLEVFEQGKETALG